ncbi:MAG: Ig-like domain-containing protein [Prevotella sp.]|nr:Ig-like domain-containing protein [Prevotella sp.]
MKYKLLRFSLLSMLVMFFGMWGNSALAADKWIKTATSGLASGDVVVIVDQTSSTAMSNDKGTSSAPAATAVTLSDDKSEIAGEVAENLQWVVTADNGSYKFGVAGTENYLYCTATNNGVRVGTNENNAFTITQGGDNNADFLVNTVTTRYIGVYNTQDWRCYTSINNNIKGCVTAFYKKTAAASTKTATKVTLSEGYATTGIIGGAIDLPTATVAAGDATVAGAAVTWTSNNTDVATIDGSTIKLLAAGTTTIKATYAGDDTYEASSASYTLTVTAAPYTSLKALQEAVTSTSTPVLITFNNVFVTAVKTSNAYLADADGYGALLYQSGHGLEAGQVLNGTVSANLVLYNGQTEITNFSKEGLTITTTELVPTVKTIDAITAANQCTLVTLKGVKYADGKLTDGTNEITYYDTFNVKAEFDTEKTYDITGIVILYNETLEFAPRSAADIVEAAATAGWKDIKADLTSTALIPEGAAQWDDVSTGIAVAADGTLSRVAKDADNAEAIFNGKWHGAQYGWAGFSASVKVEGCVKITLGQNNYGKEAVVKNANGDVVAKIDNMVAGKVWSAAKPDELISVGYYRANEPTTLTVEYGSYLGYFAVEAIDPADLPEEISEYTVTFDKGDVAGIAPAAVNVEAGKTLKIPANTTLFAEGKTLTAWTDGTKQYKAGEEVAISTNVTLTPVFTDNTVAFNDRTAEVTVTWDATQKTGGAPLIGIEGKTGFIVGQATVNGETIDVQLTIDATSGKFNNSNGEWIQVNNGTKFILPACKGASYSIYTMGDSGENTFNGKKGTYDSNYDTYTYEGSEETMEIVVGGGSWYKAITAVYPVPEQKSEAAFRDFGTELNGLLTSEDNGNVTFGLAVAEDGTVSRVAADAANAAAVINGKTGNDHGLQNFSATVPVEGAVKITMGTCSWGGEVTVKNAAGETVATFTTKKGEGGSGCYKGNKFDDENIVSAKYLGEATTLTINGGAYVNFFAVEAITASSVTVAYALGDAECQGDIVPTGGTFAAGDEYTIPAQNFTLYKEGYTLTGWSDGANTYAAGSTITLANDLNLTPVFTANEVNLSDRTEPVTVKWNFRRDQGAPAVGWEGKDGLVWVAQADVNGKTIDVALPFSTAPGKFNNKNNNDWVQINNGTKFTVPSCKGATISMEAYNNITTTTIDGQSDYTQGKTITYEIAGAAETVDVVIGDGSYYRYIQVVLPVVQSQGGGESYNNVAGTVTWAVGNEANGTVSADIAKAVQNATWSTGDGLTIEAAKYFDTQMTKYTPGTSNAGNVEGVMIEYRVKMASGITFKPTSVSYDAVKVGTDGATYSWSYVVGNTESTITEVDAATTLRNNGANSATAQLNHVLDMSEAGESNIFAMRFYISKTANNKNICIGNVIINGTVNGTAQAVELYTLATAVTPEEAGSINVYPKADEYEAGTEVTLTATENFGYDFVNWTNAAGEEVSTEAKFKYTMAANETLTANFKKVNTYELALTVDGTNDYMVTINPAPTVVDGKNMYEEGTAVQLVANQYEGLVTFTNWNDGETNSTKLVSMTEDKNIVASYAEADIIAGWDFYKAGASGRKADFAAQDNDADALNLVNTETGETQGWLDKSTIGGGGYESFKGAAVNWRTGTKNGDVGNWHWQTKVNAEAFTDINVQFMMLYNYNSYQTYNAEYSLDGETWTKFGSITMTGAKAEAAFNEQMPAAANNQKDLYIRMLADKTSAVDGAASANDGNTLAMFFITGTPKLIDDGTAPKLVSSVPENGATGASATGKIVLTFDERVKVKADAKATLGNETLTPTVSGKTITFEYKGLEYGIEYTFNLAANSVGDLTDNFLAEPITLTFTTMERPSIEKKMYDQVVSTADELVAAIAAAQARADKNVRYRIFIKNGKYTIPLSSTMKTVNGYEVPECITFINTSNVSFIGESRDGVIITNGIDKNETFAGTYGTTSKYDGIGNSDVFQISGSDYYFQDLTIESGMDDATGRDLAVQDKATRTIYKNTGLSGYQDTWTSNNDYGLYYFEGGFVRGRTDYMCGKGDAFFNGVEIRQIAGGYAAVPSKSIKYGYVYKDCTINGEGSNVDGNYTLGRPWGSGTPIALFIDTRMNVVPSAIGWNEMSGGWPKRFAEYNSTTSTGSVIDLSGRKKIFGDGHENNPVLTAEEALEAGNLHNMFGEWDPTLLTEQAPVPANVKLTGTTLTWDNSNYALLFAIVKNGQVVDFTTDATYTVDDATATYAVRAANEMGGLGEAAEASTSTGIEEVAPAAINADGKVYNLQGIRVQKAQQGVYIINGRKVVVK